ncbi:hypothetical protein ACFOGJ_14330 [Marinibaculum pumilum]|uniref:Uncharacterized protein n=1 Tax=Marinibaculum pumilum TaxID=1766165 RepID=A0ABV7L1D6_9PROT
MDKMRFGLGLAVLGLGTSIAAGAEAGCGNILTSNGSCLYFGLPEPATLQDRGAATGMAAARAGGVVCHLGDGEPLVAGHADSCTRAGGTVAPAAGAGSPNGPGPIIGYMPVTQYVPVFAAPAGGMQAAVACSFGAVRLSAASVEDCERAGGTVSPAEAAK